MTAADQKSNYIAAWMDYRDNKIVVVERSIESGERFVTKHDPLYYFYVPDEEGEHETIFGDKVLRVDAKSRDEYDYLTRNFSKKFESDFSPKKRILMDKYYGRPAPPVNFAFFDIEVDYKQSIGFAGPTNPYAPINAVTVYQSWSKQYYTIAIPPLVDVDGVQVLLTQTEGWSEEKFQEQILANWKEYNLGFDPHVILVRDELELLELFLDLIQDSDIISGWNSEFFDVPYICERMKLVLGEKSLRSLEFPGAPVPKRDMVNKFGSEEPIYKFSGRSHLDYKALFEKFTFEGRTSYALANIANEELDIPKLEYEGTLEQLYKRDFIHFVTYNARDVEVLVKLDDKFKFIALVNQMAHENTVDFSAVLGTVQYVETGIANHAHHVLKKVVHDKVISNHDKVEGAVVLNPAIGLHEWIGSVDINSLYPNTIRSLNISPETIIGQFTNKEDEADWEAIMRADPNVRCCMIFNTGEQDIRSAAEWNEWLKQNKYALSAYGTVFDQSRGRGVVPDILGFWYTERKRLQAEKKKWAKEAKALETKLKNGVENVDEIKQLLAEAKKQEEHYDLLQLTKKISMNSLYGALLNAAFRFGDERMGASVTATGRRITKHMMETMGFILTGESHPLKKARVIDDEGVHIIYTIDSPAIIYGDTDSCYYKCTGATNKEEAIAIADEAANLVNESFPDFMRSAFNCQPGFDDLIKAGREIVGRRGLFQAKKKYMVKVVDMEGLAVDKMKSQGSEIKKADTPKIIQAFIKKTVDMILDGRGYDEIADFVNAQRKTILKNEDNVFALGVAKQVNNLDAFTAEYMNFEKPGIRKAKLPGHVRASINFNEMIDIFDKGAKNIRGGDKVLIYYLKQNQYGLKSIAIPAEMTKFPKWFTENFQVDIKLTEEKMFDSKLGGVFAAIKMEVPTPQSVHVSRLVEF